MLRGAIRNFLERQENTAEEEAYHIPSVAIVENLHVKFLDDGLGNSVHTLYVSESLRDENAFTISRIRRFEAEVPNDKNVVFTRNLPIAEEKATRHLDEAGVAKAGEYLEEGDIVIGCCLHCKPTTQAMSPRQKKEYIIRTIEHINKTQRFINCLPFCFLSGRRATEDERKLCNEEIAQVNQIPAQDGEMVNILFDNDGTGQRKDDGQNDEKDADSLFDDLFNDDEH